MRFSNLFWNVSLALLATTVLILTTGVVGAAADILDSEETIDPLSPNYDGSAGGVDASGDTFGTWVAFDCLTLKPDSEVVDNDFRFECRSNHPDKVNLSSGVVDQKKPNNNAEILWTVNRLNGTNEGSVFNLLCDKVWLRGKSNNRNEQIEASCLIKNCDPPPSNGPQAISETQLKAAFKCLDTAQDEGTLGERVQTLKLLDDNTISGTIKSKGFWATDDD